MTSRRWLFISAVRTIGDIVTYIMALSLLQIQEQVEAKKAELARKKAEYDQAQKDLEPLKVRCLDTFVVQPFALASVLS